MKKFASLLIASTLGAVLAVVGLKVLNNNPQPQPTAIETPANRFVDLPLATPESTLDFTLAAESTVNAVVHVKTKSKGETYYSPLDFFFGNANPRAMPRMGSGSGVIISTDGFIVTNNHVIDGAEEIEVVLNNKKAYNASVIGKDPSTDLALLKIEDTDLPFVPYGNSESVKVGQWVLAVGNPFNLTSTVTAGIISAKGRSINILDGDANNGLPAIESFIQTDAAVNPGNSGGALVNTRGELVGINAAIKSNTGSYTGYSFAIPVNIVRKVVDDLLEFGSVQRAFIGVSIRNIDNELAESKDLPTLQGVYISGLMEDGAAADAGLKEGDIITQVNSHTVKDVPELQEQIGSHRPGDEVTLTILRNKKPETVKVMLKNRFGTTKIVEASESMVYNALGAKFEPISNDVKTKLRIGGGVQITELKAGKLRDSGVKEGFIITKIDRNPIQNTGDITAALENKKGGVLIEGVYPNGLRAYYGFGL